uniref:Uncharacterized protein n=1 Tax=Palpitomonas bilix TaxID=652834 RepID=A0A7S3GI32_9EUKA|mmetsp:Transcript_50363/g.129722  ORF Transcript_50363/g.129722 Transcript_50363/m.129722 type:complete len:287 (+) Transcript_50363:80-940(+)
MCYCVCLLFPLCPLLFPAVLHYPLTLPSMTHMHEHTNPASHILQPLPPAFLHPTQSPLHHHHRHHHHEDTRTQSYMDNVIWLPYTNTITLTIVRILTHPSLRLPVFASLLLCVSCEKTNLVVSNMTTNESFNWKRFVYLQTPIWTRVDEYLIPDEDMQLESEASNGRDIVEVWRENRKKMKEEAEMILKTEDGKEMVEIENNIAEYLGKVEKNKQESKDKEDKVGKDSCPFPTMKHFYLRRKCIVEEARTAPFYLGSAKANFAYVKNPVHFKVERSPTLDELKKRE